ncbi:MAG: hypothetical protein P0S96_07250 [Simkaniaceae bacterium]|nr:hypothetical protein [Candidatus Sacchlamyda saccharinae]
MNKRCLVAFILCFFQCVYADFWPLNLFQSENVIEVQHKGDVLVYTNNRTEEYFSALQAHYGGLPSDKVLDDLLSQQEYIEILNYLWAERDQALRISWLENKLPEGHPILIAELAIEYISRDPSIHTYLFSSRPLLDVAVCLTEIDTSCTSDASVEAATGFLNFQYSNLLLTTLLEHHPREAVQAYWKDHYIEFKNLKIALLRQFLNRFFDSQQTVPTPKWVFSHGLKAFRNQQWSAAYPENRWGEIRKKEAKNNLNFILKDEMKMKRNPEKYVSEVFAGVFE